MGKGASRCHLRSGHAEECRFPVPEINMKAYMKARSMTQEFIDDFLGYFIDPTNKHMSSLLLGCGLPGGMMGSMMADLKGVHSGINLILKGQGQGADESG